jgi:hypothetical protein
MPDFERLMDAQALHAAPDPKTRARVEGLIAGKTRARLEVAVIALAAGLLTVLIMTVATGGHP